MYKAASMANRALNTLWSMIDVCTIADIVLDKPQNIRGRACSLRNKGGHITNHVCMRVECGELYPCCLPCSSLGIGDTWLCRDVHMGRHGCRPDCRRQVIGSIRIAQWQYARNRVTSDPRVLGIEFVLGGEKDGWREDIGPHVRNLPESPRSRAYQVVRGITCPHEGMDTS